MFLRYIMCFSLFTLPVSITGKLGSMMVPLPDYLQFYFSCTLMYNVDHRTLKA